MAGCCPVCNTRLRNESALIDGTRFGWVFCPVDRDHCGRDPNCGDVFCQSDGQDDPEPVKEDE